MLHRDRLTERLQANIGTGLAVIQAPAGFGKTALLADFVSLIKDDYAVAWLSLDGSCTAPESLAAQVGSALLGEGSAWNPASATRIEDLKSYLDAVCRAAVEATQLPILLIIENAHELRDADDSSELVGWLLDILPHGAEVILSGREAARLREVDRRVAAGECLLLDATDLAFTADEVATLAAQEKCPLQVGDIVDATAGWPIAVMAIVSGTVSLDGAVRARGSEAWDRYLVEEVWRAVPPAFQERLLTLSVPPIIDREIAIALVGDAAWRKVGPWLLATPLLGEPLGNGFRLNPQVRRFLRTEFDTRSPEAFAAVLEQTVDVLERRGQVADAIELTRAAGNAGLLARIMEVHSRELLQSGAFGLLWRGYQALPKETLSERPGLLAVGSRILAHHSLPNESLEASEAVFANPDANGTARLDALLGKARALRLLGRVDDLVALFDAFRTTMDCDDPTVVAELAWQEAQTVLGTTSDFGRAERLLHDAAEHAVKAGAKIVELLIRSTLGQLYAMRGDGPDAITELTRAARGWRDLHGSGNLGWVLNNLGMAHLLVGDFEAAASVLKEARMESRACENIRNEAYSIASLADAEVALGRFAEAKELYEEAIRICATDVLDESLASLSISGLSASQLGLGDLKEADYFSRRALLVAEAFGNPMEIALCKLQQAAVEDAAQNHAAAIADAHEAIELFQPINATGPLRTAWYKLAIFLFRAGHRAEAQEALQSLDRLVTEPWMAGPLLPLIREQPMFAQWAASRALPTRWFRDLLERQTFAPAAAAASDGATTRLPKVVAKSLGTVHVTVGDRELSDEAWASSRAKELFFLFLANRSGLRKEEAAVALYPDVSPAGCNSAFHSNLYRLRRALYPESIIKRDGSYILNPDADFEWDVDLFLAGMDAAKRLPAGSPERARAAEKALAHYQGPFAEAFYAEWAGALRHQLADRSQEALSTLAGYYAARNDFDGAAKCLERILESDRYNEQAAFELATYRLRASGPTAALAFLDSYRQTMREELGEELPERFQTLRHRIAAGAM